MTSPSVPQPLAPDAPAAARGRMTWIILAAAVAVVALSQFSFGTSDSRECEREAHANAAIATALGGQARYVEMCIEMQRKVGELRQAPRKP